MEFILQVNDLEDLRKKDQDLIILEVKHFDKELAYDQFVYGHIKDAQFLDIGDFRKRPVDEKIQILESLGITRDSIVVIYDDGELIGPSRAYIEFKNLGLEELYILEGGTFAYQMSGLGMEEGPGQNRQVKLGTFSSNNEAFIQYVDKEFLDDKVGKEDWLIIDARSPHIYEEDHVEGAVNFFYGWFKTPRNSFVSKERAEEIFEDYLDYDNILIYCNSSMSASIPALVLKSLGKNPLIYRSY